MYAKLDWEQISKQVPGGHTTRHTAHTHTHIIAYMQPMPQIHLYPKDNENVVGHLIPEAKCNFVWEEVKNALLAIWTSVPGNGQMPIGLLFVGVGGCESLNRIKVDVYM